MFVQEWKSLFGCCNVAAMTSDDTAQSSPEFWRIYGKPSGNQKKTNRDTVDWISALAKWYDQCLRTKKSKAGETDVEISSCNSGLFLDFNLSLFQMKSPGGREPDLQLKFFFKVVLLSQFEEQCRQWGVGANDISTRFFLTFLYFYRRFLHYFYASVGKLISWFVLFSNPWTPRKAELQLNASSSISLLFQILSFLFIKWMKFL